MAAWPSKLMTGGSPQIAATASNSRPMLLVRGELTPPRQHRQQRVHLAGVEPLGGVLPGLLAEDLEQQPQGRAPRLAHGAIAAGQGERAQMGRAAKLRPFAHAAPRRPRPFRRGRSPCRPRRIPAPAPASRVRPCTPPRGRGDAARAPAARPIVRPAARRAASRRSRDADRRRPRRASSGRTPADRRSPGETPRRSARCPGRRRGRSSRPALTAGRWPPAILPRRCARRRAAAPPCSSSARRRRESSAHRRPRTCNSIGSGANPRARRSICGPSGPTRTIESSTGRTIGRLCVSSTSAIGPSRSMASSMVDGHRLFGEIAAGADHRPPDGRHQQVVQRRVGQHHAQVRIAGSDAGEGRGERGEGRGIG